MVTRMYFPDELLEKFKAYIKWVEDNPICKYSLIQKTGETVAVPLGRPLSHKAFLLYAGMSATLYAAYNKLPEYEEVMDVIKNSIYVNKYEGAAVGLFSSAIMIRDLGLADNIIHTMDDTRKSISELFPSDDELNKLEPVKETNQLEHSILNTLTNENEKDKQELCFLNPNGEEQL